MSAREPTSREQSDIVSVADNVFDQLQGLPYPPHAAHALAIANARLIVEAENPEISSEEQVRVMMRDMTEVVVKRWKSLNERLS